jgi:DNA-binding transcriptional LysR family regulator
MTEKFDWEHQIGRRIKLRDLQIFLTVTQHGSMARAAAHLGVSQPSVSGVIADLEHTLGVPLFDRSSRGVKPTMYALAMMDRSVAAFDELKQGIRTLENLADPAAGELWIGCIESVSASMLPPIVHQFMQRYPRVVVHVARLSSPTPEFRELCGRNLDLVLTRIVRDSTSDNAELNVEPLFEDRLVVAAGAHSHWARRRKIDFGDLVDEPWVLTPPDCWTNKTVMAAFRARGLKTPNVCLMTYSVPLRMNLAASGPYVTVFPGSVRPLDAYRSIKVLPIELPASRSTLAIVTLKNRMLNPVARCFIEHLRSDAAANSRLCTGVSNPSASRA